MFKHMPIRPSRHTICWLDPRLRITAAPQGGGESLSKTAASFFLWMVDTRLGYGIGVSRLAAMFFLYGVIVRYTACMSLVIYGRSGPLYRSPVSNRG